MRITQVRHLIVVTSILASVAVAAAQGFPPAGPRQQGGPGQGGPGFPGGPRMGMQRGGIQPGPGLLMRPDVQKELKLGETQIEKIRELMPQRGMGMPGRPGLPGGPGQGGPGGPGGPGQGGPEMMQQLEKRLKAILSETQYTRYQQLSFQAGGVRMLLRPELAEKLGITEEQREQIMEAGRPPMPQGGQPGQRPDPNEMEKRRKEVEAKMLAVLTPAQRKQWAEMTGPAFKFKQLPPRG